jgi:hypothetical protein
MIPNAQTAVAGHPEAMAQLALAILQDAAKHRQMFHVKHAKA